MTKTKLVPKRRQSKKPAERPAKTLELTPRPPAYWDSAEGCHVLSDIEGLVDEARTVLLNYLSEHATDYGSGECDPEELVPIFFALGAMNAIKRDIPDVLRSLGAEQEGNADG